LLPTLLLTIALIGVFWTLMIRPQQQRQRAHRTFVETLAPGDRIEAFSGIHGTIAGLGEETVEVEVAPGVVVTMARLAIASRVDEPRPAADGADTPRPAPLEDQVNPTDPRPSTSTSDLDGGAS
jgi:preprotein translocase subunit YajC